MDNNTFIAMVQEQTGYTFKNSKLLLQAFTRQSYSEENGGENNELLEFIGDKALDLAVIRLLVQKFGNIGCEDVESFHQAHPWIPIEMNFKPNKEYEFHCELDENQLTRLKSRLVEKHNLARRTDELGFAQFLKMGKGDILNSVQDQPSVKEDLFEAIVGAITLDCKWNFEAIVPAVEAMLELNEFLLDDNDTNYVRLIQEWEQDECGVIPLYCFRDGKASICIPFNGIEDYPPLGTPSFSIRYTCDLKLRDDLPVFRAYGASKSEARMAVCRLAYKYLEKEDMLPSFSIRDEIDEPCKEKAINQLEILARRGYFSIPTYDFDEKYDKDGNPIWTCTCHIKEMNETFCTESSSKKDAKKASALEMLKFVLVKED